MADRGKVIEGLEFHLKELSVGKTCYECPYVGDNPCEIQLIAGALELLKEQEPHVLTVAEINKLPTGEYESIPVVMEEKYPFQKWDGGSICKWVGSQFAVSQYRESLEEMPYEWYTYGKTMRFWSGMPTEEQRKGTAWNG